MKETHQGFLSRSIPARRRRSLRGRLRTKKEDTQMRVFLFGAGGRTRTGTEIIRLILSQVRLPIPPHRQNLFNYISIT